MHVMDFVERSSQYAICVGSCNGFLIVCEMEILIRTWSFFLILKMNIGNHCATEKHLNTFLQTLLKTNTGNFTLKNILQKIMNELEHTKINFFASLAARALLKFLLSSGKAVLCQERQSQPLAFSLPSNENPR